MQINEADVAELVEARDLKSLDGNVVWVRVPPPAPSKKRVSRQTKAANPTAAVSAKSPAPSSRPPMRWLWLAGRSATGTDVGRRCWANCKAMSSAGARPEKRF